MQEVNAQENQKRLVHIAYFSTRWTDMDAFGHVNNGVYFNYFDEARVSWWEAIGINLNANQEGPIIAAAACRFERPIFYPANLAIKVYVSELRRSSFTVFYDICQATDSSLIYADGSTVVVWFNYQTQCSTPLTNELREKLTSYI